jgi:nucleotide-binding universal stress UspA family protein
MFKTIVVGVDGLAGGRDALSLTARLAAAESPEIVAVRVVEPPPAVSPVDPRAAVAAARTAVEEDLTDAGIAAGRADVVFGHSPARELHAAARRENADLLVVGSSHRGAVGRVLFGDIAVRVLRDSPCAVAIAPRGTARAAVRGGIETIGVGFDGNDEAREALRFAAALARARGARLRALSVVTIPATLAATSSFDETWVEAYRDEADAHLQRALAGVVGVKAAGVAVAGNPVVKLATLSGEVDLLVLGSRAWGAMRRAVPGSTAATLSHDAHCPLLVLPRGAAWTRPEEPTADWAEATF